MFSLRRVVPALAIMMAVPSVAARAATFNVPSGDVSALKNALNAANSNGQNDIINLAAGGIYTLSTVDNDPGSSGDSAGATGLPVIGADGGKTVLINGNGALILRSGAPDTPGFRLLKVEAGAAVTLDSLTLSGGSPDPYSPGGAILNAGITTLQGMRGERQSRARRRYRGLGRANVIRARDSIFEDNNGTLGSSGGALSTTDGRLDVIGCTFTGNGNQGGGAHRQPGCEQRNQRSKQRVLRQ